MQQNGNNQIESDPRYQTLTESGFSIEPLIPPCDGDNWIIYGPGGETGAETLFKAMDVAWKVLGYITLLPEDEHPPQHRKNDTEISQADSESDKLDEQWAAMTLPDQISAIKLKRDNFVMPNWMQVLADQADDELDQAELACG